MAQVRHEFGEHGGVNLSIETSSTFTVLEAGRMPDIFDGRAGPAGGCYLYGRHFNPTVMVLSRQLAVEGEARVDLPRPPRRRDRAARALRDGRLPVGRN
jgi:methionine-gamma-lyase